MQPRGIDNDKGDITVEVFGREVRGWSYKDDTERRAKMVAAHEYAEGWHQGLARMKEHLDLRLNNCLCEMKPNYDDSITGFNEAWNLMRRSFAETAPSPEPLEREPPQQWSICNVCGGSGEEMSRYWGHEHGCGHGHWMEDGSTCNRCHGEGGWVGDVEGYTKVNRPFGSNADEWHLFLVENVDILPYLAVQIAEAIEAAQVRFWTAFVSQCEIIEDDADRLLQTELEPSVQGFYRGQRLCAKAIRRAVQHPRYEQPAMKITIGE